MRGVFGLLLLMLLGQSGLAATLDGEYHATLDGMPTELHLHNQGNAVDGLYIENGSLRLNVRGTFDGQRLDAQILGGSGQPSLPCRAPTPTTASTHESPRATRAAAIFSAAMHYSSAARQARSPAQPAPAGNSTRH